MTNPDFTGLFKEMELNIIKLMEQIGAIPEQLSQYMQTQTTTAPQGQSLPGAGGVLPGSNPMDMLQLQQFMQMQQMQQQQTKK